MYSVLGFHLEYYCTCSFHGFSVNGERVTYVFPMALLVMTLNKDANFGIDLVPGTHPICAHPTIWLQVS